MIYSKIKYYGVPLIQIVSKPNPIDVQFIRVNGHILDLILMFCLKTNE